MCEHWFLYPPKGPFGNSESCWLAVIRLFIVLQRGILKVSCATSFTMSCSSRKLGTNTGSWVFLLRSDAHVNFLTSLAAVCWNRVLQCESIHDREEVTVTPLKWKLAKSFRHVPVACECCNVGQQQHLLVKIVGAPSRKEATWHGVRGVQ